MAHAQEQPATDPQGSGKHRNKIWAAIREVIIVVVAALLISLLVKTFFFRAFYIPSGSMEMTLQENDRIFANLLVPGPFDVQRGDVVVFRDELDWLPPIEPLPTNVVGDFLTFVGLMPDPSNQHLVKRIIGMPGDTVVCCSTDGKLSINGTEITEPYIYPGDEPSLEEFKVTVPEGKVWVMGDHRSASADSRFHMDTDGGFVSISAIEGKAGIISWPLNRIGVISNHSEVFEQVPTAPAVSK